MDLPNISDELYISHNSLQYYCGRYADDLTLHNNILDTLARIVLFRKLGASHSTIHSLVVERFSIHDALSACPKATRYLHVSVFEDLCEKQWTDVSCDDCIKFIKSCKLRTPKQDVFFWGRLLDNGSAISVAAGIAASFTFVHQRGWEDIALALIAGGVLTVTRAVVYTVMDIMRWKRLRDYKAP